MFRKSCSTFPIKDRLQLIEVARILIALDNSPKRESALEGDRRARRPGLMATDLIRYDLLVQDALRSVVRKVLSDAAAEGLPGEHHFYITFRTQTPGVRLSNRMREEYPDEMTIILQHQFWGLNVLDQGFEVGLSFHKVPETLYIPYEAMTGFFDPSVQFALKFELNFNDDEGDEDSALEHALDAALTPVKSNETKLAPVAGLLPSARSSEASDEPGEGDQKVVSIDAFRKKT